LTATAGTLTVATLTPTDLTVAAISTVNFNITATHKVTAGGSIRVLLPKWNPNAASIDRLSMIQGSFNCGVLENVDSTITCTFDTTTDILTVSNAFDSADVSAGTTIRFSCFGIRNPISTAIKTGFTITTLSVDGGNVDSATSTYQVSSAASIVSGTVASLTTRIVQELTVIRLIFPSPVPLDQGCIILIQFPSSLQISQTDLISIRGVGLFGTSRILTNTITTANNTVTITDGCLTYIEPDFDAILEFTSIENPLSTMPTDSLNIIVTDVSGNMIAQKSTGVQYVATFGAMTSASLSATPSIIRSTSSVSVYIVPTHKITTAGALKITFPSQFTFPSATCTLTITTGINAASTCSVSGYIVRITSPFATDYIPASSPDLNFTINSIIMPATTAPTGTYTFQSVLVDNSIDYLIDQLSATDLITATVGTITVASVTPASFLAYELTTYTISFQNTHDIVQNGQLQIIFASEITIPTPAVSANTCTAISGIDSGITCNANSTTLTINSGFQTAALALGSTVAFSVGNIRNPVSLEQTSSFTIKTLTDDDFNIDQVTSGVTLTMTSVNDINTIEITPESLVNGATTTIEFNIVASSPLQNGDLLLITYPTQVSAPSTTIT
jgi:hypothetical protein